MAQQGKMPRNEPKCLVSKIHIVERELTPANCPLALTCMYAHHTQTHMYTCV